MRIPLAVAEKGHPRRVKGVLTHDLRTLYELDAALSEIAESLLDIRAARACLALGEELPMHIGIHAGDVISEGTNVYGGAVNIASRICGPCQPGEILVSSTVRDLARTSAGVVFEDRGAQEMKGFGEPVRVYVVRAEE